VGGPFCLALVLASGQVQGEAATAAPDPLAIQNVHLGMSLEAWKALPFPGAPSNHVQPICTDDAVGEAGGLLPTASPRVAGTVVCGYFSRYGRFNLPKAIALGPGIEAEWVGFDFLGGRLSSIDYRTSADVYDDLLAGLTARFGPPSRGMEDDVRTGIGLVPRVRQTWNTPQGVITLVDPVQPFTQIGIRLSARTAS
jgi:hypothetical protein